MYSLIDVRCNDERNNMLGHISGFNVYGANDEKGLIKSSKFVL